jgi:cytochrome c-type biogenesis protein CcmH
VILFWAICAVMLLIALAFVLPPALERSKESDRESENEGRKQANIAVYRDQLSELDADLKNGLVSEEQYAQDQQEIERRVLEDTTTAKSDKAIASTANARSTAYALGLALPLVAIIFYLNVGNPKSIGNETVAAGPAPNVTGTAPPQRSQEQIEANVAALAKRLQSNPSDAAGWTMLARSYSSMDKYGEAAGAYAKATELTPNNADLWAEYAFASAMAGGKSLQGKPMEFIDRALKVDPENAKALQLAGSAAFEAKDYKKAIAYWERVLKRVPADSEAGKALTERVNEAKSLAAGK